MRTQTHRGYIRYTYQYRSSSIYFMSFYFLLRSFVRSVFCVFFFLSFFFLVFSFHLYTDRAVCTNTTPLDVTMRKIQRQKMPTKKKRQEQWQNMVRVCERQISNSRIAALMHGGIGGSREATSAHLCVCWCHHGYSAACTSASNTHALTSIPQAPLCGGICIARSPAHSRTLSHALSARLLAISVR